LLFDAYVLKAAG